MLTSNPKFQKEYQEFSDKISKISDEENRTHATQLLQRMLGEARSIDRQHEELMRGAKFAADVVADHRSLLTQYRQQITKKIQDCERAGLIKS